MVGLHSVSVSTRYELADAIFPTSNILPLLEIDRMDFRLISNRLLCPSETDIAMHLSLSGGLRRGGMEKNSTINRGANIATINPDGELILSTNFDVISTQQFASLSFFGCAGACRFRIGLRYNGQMPCDNTNESSASNILRRLL